MNFPLLKKTMLALGITCFASGANAQTTPQKPSSTSDQLIVISYHEVVSHADRPLIPSYAVSVEQLTQHLNTLKQQGYHFVSVDQVLAAHKGKQPLPEHAVMLTFDDGYKTFYKNAFPVLKSMKIPAVIAVVGKWVEPKDTQPVDFAGEQQARDQFLSWQEMKTMQDSGLIEVASHSYDLHKGINANPQHDSEAAAIVHAYHAHTHSYESDAQYNQRIFKDLKTNNQLLRQHGLKSPRVMVWPYGRYNSFVVKTAAQLGMPITMTLDDGINHVQSSLGALTRVLVDRDMDAKALQTEIQSRQLDQTDNNRPQKIMHVDLDYIYDKDPAQQERNLGVLLDRINAMKVNTVYLQAFSDPDGNGSADLVYFPNRHIPLRADLFNHVAWSIQTRTAVRRVYAWMPIMAWEFPKNEPAAQDRVETEQGSQQDRLNMGYLRVSPFSPRVRRVVTEIYQDLAKSTPFNGLLFHDDMTLSDYEDVSPIAKTVYAQNGMSTDFVKVRQDDQQLQKWTAFKTSYLDNFAKSLVTEVRRYQPFLMTARNLYAQVALKPYAENWYSQSLEESLKNYDFTAIMAMPYMENVAQPDQFYAEMLDRVKQYPEGLKKTVFELQTVDWRNQQKIPSTEIANTINSLYQQGAIHVAYYPDDPIQEHPDPAIVSKAFDQKSNSMVP